MRIELADPCLVVLIGASGSGKSTFARTHFLPTEVISSDFCRGLVADDENDQSATPDAFEVLQFIAGRRLAQPRFTVVDATNVQRESRRPLLELAKRHDLFTVAIVLDAPEALCQERNRARSDRDFGPHVVRSQRSQLRRSLKGLRREGFQRVWVLPTPQEVDFLDGLVSHAVLDDGRLVVAHAGMKEVYQGRSSGRVREFALFGETTGETDAFGLPVRLQWARDYRGQAAVVYGHTPVAEAEWVNNTINIDTGCVFGGRLTALRWPERELVSVSAGRTYYEPAKPFLDPDAAAPGVGEEGRARRSCSTSTMSPASGSCRRAWPGRSPCARRTRPPRSRS